MLPGWNEGRPQRIVRPVEGARLPVERQLPSWEVRVPKNQKSRARHLCADPHTVETLFLEIDRGLGVEFDASRAEQIAEITEHSRPIPIYHRPDGSVTNW